MGGPKDTTPPKILSLVPENFLTNFKAKEIAITFDEYIKLKNEFTEISISPALDLNPLFKIKKKTLHVTLQDSLTENTTYSINFGNSITDFNEGNELKNFTYVFSTGDQIDSLSISGKIIHAETLEPQSEVTVILHPANQDTLFTKIKANVFSRTDTAGRFSINNLKEGKYLLYALKETNNDRIYNHPDESIAFLKDTINLLKDTSNIELKLFKEIPENFRLINRNLDNQGKITFVFNKSLKEPTIKILDNPDAEENKRVEFTLNKDSAFVWLPDYNFDSIAFEILDKNTVLEKTSIKRSKRDEYDKEIILKANIQNRIVNKIENIKVEASAPIGEIDKSKIILMEDSLKRENYTLNRADNNLRNFTISYNWQANKNYSLKFDKNAIKGVYGAGSKENNFQFTYETAENYGDINLNIIAPDSTGSYIVQLLNDKDEVMNSKPILGSQLINYKNLYGMKYKVRIIYDENKNQIWDTGNLKFQTQPEKVWFWNKIISIRPNWEQEDTIIIPPIN